ncbi:MAG TPA: CPBP family intramembrane glutamic endopeptidase [Propionibacteriaceae bacterium]|nr:CPBP family intramembrane glutamic endopeptidase [Propionibacteriaceae bacterium]
MSISAADDPYLAMVSDSAAATTPEPDPRPAGVRRTRWVARHRIGAFLVLAFALSWWPWPLALLNPASTAMVSFGPLIAAVVVAALAGGRPRLLGLLRGVGRWRVPWSRWALALVGPFLAAGAVGALALTAGIVEPSSLAAGLDWSTWSAVPLLLVTTALLGGPLFEEVGWRGFLLEELQRRRSALASTLLVALIWSVWHLPLLISEPTGQRPPLPFVVWIVAQAVLFTWLYNTSSGSVLLAIVFHATINVSTRLLLEPLVGQDNFAVIWWLMAAAYCLVAAVVLVWTRGLRRTTGGE